MDLLNIYWDMASMENKKTDWWFSFENRYSGLLALLSGEPISASVKTSDPSCSWGLRPLEPQQGAAPVAHWGARDAGPQTYSPPAWGGSGPQCHLLNLILLPLEIVLTTLETSGSVAKCRLFSKARYTCILIKEDVIHLGLRLIRSA